MRRYAELTAATGGWEKALKAFAAVGGTLGETAQSELDGTATSAALADFWWNYKPLEADAADAIRDRAAFHYRAALDANELDGLALTLAEQRLAQSDPPPAAQSSASQPSATPKVEYRFNYILDNYGNATLCKTSNDPGSNRGDACVSPKPIGELTIPEYIDGHKIVAIGRDAFDGCDKVTKIVLPKSLERLNYGPSFCAGCYALKEIVISATNPHFSTFDGALFTKDRKCLLVHPKARSAIRFPPETREIETWAFISYNLKTLKLPKGITHVKGYSISYCPNLEVVEFPDSLSRIDEFIFCGTPNVTKVIFNGDAPSCGPSLLGKTNAEPVIEVKRGTRGWKSPSSTELPERWPFSGKTSPIRYIK